MKISRMAWEEWTSHPVTAAYLAELERLLNQEKDHLAAGKTLNGDNAHSTLSQTAQSVGKIEGLKLAIWEAVGEDEIEE